MVLFPDNAIVAARLTDTNVFPSPENVEVRKIVLDLPSCLCNINSRFVRTILIASALLERLLILMSWFGESEVGTSTKNGIGVLPSISRLVFIFVSNRLIT